MQGKRVDRVGQLVQQEMSKLILGRTKDPRIGFTTVTHVKMTADLKSAVVFVSVMGTEKVKLATIAGLEHARGFFQHEIGEALKLRFTPKIQFELDRSIVQHPPHVGERQGDGNRRQEVVGQEKLHALLQCGLGGIRHVWPAVVATKPSVKAAVSARVGDR